MCELQDYLKSLNPKTDEQAILIYGKKYKLWREGKYLGIAIWSKDENIGDSFQNTVLDEESGHFIQQVYIADKWELVVKDVSSNGT